MQLLSLGYLQRTSQGVKKHRSQTDQAIRPETKCRVVPAAEVLREAPIALYLSSLLESASRQEVWMESF